MKQSENYKNIIESTPHPPLDRMKTLYPLTTTSPETQHGSQNISPTRNYSGTKTNLQIKSYRGTSEAQKPTLTN